MLLESNPHPHLHGQTSCFWAPGLTVLRLQAIQQNLGDVAKIYAQNAIRKQNERLNLLRLASRIDAVSSRVQTAVTMRQVTGSMANVVKGMDSAMKAMDLEKVSYTCRRPWRAKQGNGTNSSFSPDIRRHGQIRRTI